MGGCRCGWDHRSRIALFHWCISSAHLGLVDASVHKVLFLQTRMKSEEAASLVATSLQGRKPLPLLSLTLCNLFGQGCVYFWNYRTAALMGKFSAVSAMA